MKKVTLRNKMNGEHVFCNDTKFVKVIDGVEYVLVHRKGSREFLMRKEALEKVKD